MYQNEFAIHIRVVNTQNEVIELMEATAVDRKKTILALNKFTAAKHGRKHTGRRRGRSAQKAVWVRWKAYCTYEGGR
jgi:hypothetical protein